MSPEKKEKVDKSDTQPVKIMPGLFTFDHLERDEDLEKSILRFVYDDMIETPSKEKKSKKATRKNS